MGVFLVTSGLGNYVANLLVVIVKVASNGDWYPVEDPNHGHFEYFFFLLAGLMMLNFLVFLFVASSYKYKTSSGRNFWRDQNTVQQAKDNPQVWSEWELYQSRPSTIEIILFFFFVLAFVLCLALFSGSQSTPFLKWILLAKRHKCRAIRRWGKRAFCEKAKKKCLFHRLDFWFINHLFLWVEKYTRKCHYQLIINVITFQY